MSIRTYLAAMGSVALLAACAGPVSAPSEPSAVATRASATTPKTQFEISGRFSARTSTEQASGQFKMEQSGALRKLVIYSPLGSVVAEISADAQQARLVDAQGAQRTADTLVDLLREVIDIPVTDVQLSAWLQGLPSQTATLTHATVERDAQGLPSFFSESGWDIVVSARDVAIADGWAGPLRMRWAMRGQPDTEIRWVIDGWVLP